MSRTGYIAAAKASDLELGILLDWIRDEWRDGNETRHHVIQDEIVPTDSEMFKANWATHVAGLLNAETLEIANHSTTALGDRVNSTITALLKGHDADTTE